MSLGVQFPYLKIIVVICSTITSLGSAQDGTLIQVQVVFRHGERNPTETYPTDPYKDEATYWPEGFGELSELGRSQQFQLGKFLRDRYRDFLPIRYSKHDIFVMSSDKDRAIMSAQATLGGLYPPQMKDSTNDKSWNPYINWQLVPIHTLPRENDSMLDMKAPCPRFSKLFPEFYGTSEFVQALEAEHMPMIKYLLYHMGLSADTTLMRLLTFQDTLMVQRDRNMTLPGWLTPEIYEELSSLRHFRYEVETYTPELKRLRGGPLIKKLLENMATAIQKNSSENPKKMFLFSGHEGSLGALLNTVGIFNHLPPPYAAAVIFELYKQEDRPLTDNKNYFLKVSYHNDSSPQPYSLDIPNCDEPCPVEEFITYINPFIPEDWEEECNYGINFVSHTAELSGNVGVLTTLISLAGTLAIFAVITILIFRKKWRRQSFTSLTTAETRPLL